MPLAFINGVNTDSYAYRKVARVSSKAERSTSSNKRTLSDGASYCSGCPNR